MKKNLNWAFNKGIVSEGSWFGIDVFGTYLGPYQCTSVLNKNDKRLANRLFLYTDEDGLQQSANWFQARPVSIKK